MTRILFFLLVALQCNFTLGQIIEENFTTLNTGNNGLLDSRIFSLAYGPDGKVWIATMDGFSFFDGTNWSYLNYDEFYQGLTGSILLLTHSNGDLWINGFAAQNALLRYTGDSIISYGASQGYFWNSVESNLFEDNEGNIILLQPGTILKCKNDSFYSIGPPPSFQLFNSNIAQDPWNKLIVSASGKTYRQGLEGWDELFNYSSDKILCTSDSITWLGTGNYFNLFIGDSLIEEILVNNLPNSGVNPLSQIFSNLIEDELGNVWGHPNGKKGLLKLNAQGYSYYNSDSVGFLSNIFVDELLLTNGKLWFASWVCGIEEWDGNQFNHINTYDGLIQNTIKSIVSKSDAVIFGTNNGFSTLHNNHWQSEQYATDSNIGNGFQINDMVDLGYGRTLLATENHSIVLKDTAFIGGFVFLEGFLNPVSFGRKITKGFNNDYWVPTNVKNLYWHSESYQIQFLPF